MAKPTIKAMQAEIDKLKASYDESRNQLHRANALVKERENQRDGTAAQVEDLKVRLATAEFENQRMRGYIQRVQEDDTVREELLTVGDPEGEKHMVPKRKSTSFDAPSQFSNTGEIDDRYLYRNDGEPRRKAKNWITY